MKKTPALAALCLLTISMPAMADTFTLKDGTTLEGKILKEEPDSYILEVQVTKSIKDERVVAKADIVKTDREQPDLKSFEAIAKFVPTPDLLTEDDYLVKVNAVNKFLKEHPASPKAKDAKAILSTLKSEAAILTSGGIKLNGKFVTPEEYKGNAYELDARVLEAKIRTLLTDGQLVPALRAFTDFDKEYQTTLAYGSLAPLMKQAIQAYVSDAKQSLLTLDSRLKERQVGLDRMASEDRSATTGAIEEEAAAMKARFEAEKQAKVGWVTLSPFNKEVLDEAVRVGQAELTRLGTVKTVLGVDGGKAYREVYSAVHSGANAATLTAAIAAAKTATVPARYLAPLEAEAKGRK